MDLTEAPFEFPSPEITDLVVAQIIEHFRAEGFFINMLELDQKVYQIRKDKFFISLDVQPLRIVCTASPLHMVLVKTVVFESLLDTHAVIGKLQELTKPEALRNELSVDNGKVAVDLAQLVDVRCISLHLQATTKSELIAELTGLFPRAGLLKSSAAVTAAILEREQQMSTGMRHGIALPHCRTNAIMRPLLAIGLKPEGIEFQSLDSQPCRIFMLLVSPSHTTGPHLQVLAALAGILKDAAVREALLACRTPFQVVELLTKQD